MSRTVSQMQADALRREQAQTDKANEKSGNGAAFQVFSPEPTDVIPAVAEREDVSNKITNREAPEKTEAI